MARSSSALPKDATKNGLDAIASELLLDQLKRHLVLAVVDGSKITTGTATGDCEATVRVLRIEQVHPGDVAEAGRPVRRALEYRSRDTVLPIDLAGPVACGPDPLKESDHHGETTCDAGG